MNKERKLTEKKEKQTNRVYVPNVRMLFGIDTNQIYIEKLNLLGIRELIKPININFLLTATFRMGTVFKNNYALKKQCIFQYIDRSNTIET